MDAGDWDRRYEGQDLVWSAEPNRFVAAELEHVPPGRALDWACGEGRNAVWLAARGWDVTAVDFSGVAVDKGRRLADAADVQVDWVVADVTTWSPPGPGFDLVLWCYLQLSAPARAAALGRAADAVAAGGAFLLVTHDLSNLDGGYGGPQDPAVLSTPEEIVAALPDGLVVDRAEVIRRPVDTSERGRVALDTLVLAHRR